MSIKKIKGFGINVVFKKFSINDIEFIVEKLCELRVEWIRLEFDFENDINTLNYDYFIKLCKLENIKILGLLSRSTLGNIKNIFFPEKKYKRVLLVKNEYLNFVKKVVNKYKKQISYWEIWNEPNFKRFWPGKPCPLEYGMLLIGASKLIKKIDPNAKIVFGGNLGINQTLSFNILRPSFFNDFIKFHGDSDFDYAAFHPYLIDCYFSLRSEKYYKKKLDKKFQKFIVGIRKISKKPIWFNEFGISPRWVRISQKEIARIYVWYLKYLQKYSISLFLWQLYDIKSKSFEIGTPEKHFGLLNENLKPKPVYKYLVSELDNFNIF